MVMKVVVKVMLLLLLCETATGARLRSGTLRRPSKSVDGGVKGGSSRNKIPEWAANLSSKFQEKTGGLQYWMKAFDPRTDKPITKPTQKSVKIAKRRWWRNEKKKVLILMSDTGGGHRASAEAIDYALRKQFRGKLDVHIMDIWSEHAKKPFSNMVPMYRFLALNRNLWRLSFHFFNFPPCKKITEQWSQISSYNAFKAAIVNEDPDIVVSVHPLCQRMPIWIVNEMNAVRPKTKVPISFVTVVTDLGGAHGTWFDRRADAFFVPSDVVRRKARNTRMRPDRILQRGLPIRREFWERGKPKAKLRRRLGLDKNAQTVLLMGGGDGVGGIDHIVKEVCKECEKIPAQSQVVAICGNNKKLMHDLSTRTYPDNVKVVVKGFVSNVDEFMGASDCLVTKAGPGTIAEAMTRGLPMVLSSFLPGQEAGNVPYVVDGGFGLSPEAPDKPAKIAKSVRKLLTDDQRRTEMGNLALGASRPSATKDIARDIGSIVLRETVELPKLPLGYEEKEGEGRRFLGYKFKD